MPLPEIKYHARRLLNPFQGTVQIVETDLARAISSDGLHWRIQIRSNIYKLPWNSLAIPTQAQRHFNYGMWSCSEGLTRVPVHPSLYQEHVEHAVADLLAQLSQLEHKLPFPLTDRFELWLFDTRLEQPVALLASCHALEEITQNPPLLWYPAAHRDSEFNHTANIVSRTHATLRLPDLDMLEIHVRQRCPGSAYWIERHANADSRILYDHLGDPPRRDTLLSVHDFPAYLLTDTWEDTETTQLVADYHAWQAPLLLMLPLTAAQRCALELAAAQQPLRVQRYYRLYPEIHDPALLNKILVEAVMRQSQTG